MIRRKIFDLDDTLIDKRLDEIPGVCEFLAWSPHGNYLVTWAKQGSLHQEDKLKQTGLILHFPHGRFVPCPTADEKRWNIGRLIKEALAEGVPPHEILVAGDRPDIELAVAVEYGCKPLRIKLADGKYREQIFDHPHHEAANWLRVPQLDIFR